MRWLLTFGIAIFAAGWACHAVRAQEGHEEGSDAAHAGTGGHDHAADHDAESDEHLEEHAEHPQPIYDGDHDGVVEDYNQPPLRELTAVRFLWALGLFVLFVFVMRKFAWGPLIVALNAREARVKAAHAYAEAAKTEMQELIRQHEARIAEAQEEVQSIVAAARQEGERMKRDIIEQADAETRALLESSIAEIEAAKREALDQLAARVDDYTELATRHVAGEVLNN